MTDTTVPPLFTDYTSAGADPWPLACQAAADGTDAGLVIHDIAEDRLRAAVVFAPDLPLRHSAVMLPLCGVAFQTALGILGPPALVPQLGWDGTIYVNGAQCGSLAMTAATHDPDAVPDWLVVGLILDLRVPNAEGGLTPDRTALFAEGCGDVVPAALLAGWLRQILVCLDTWHHEGLADLRTTWTGMAHGLDETFTFAGETGVAAGVDDGLNLLLTSSGKPRIIPLSTRLKDRP